jgi:arylsulfatase A-like enzyme
MTIIRSILLAVLTLALTARAAGPTPRPPNVVLIFCDDLAYADLGCYGSKNPTPNLDRMAAQGLRLTDFYAAQPVCSASRAALLTGSYPNRIGIIGALGPGSKTGLSDREFTLPKMFKARNYATAIFGKWHLGDAPQFLPTRNGFDEFYGVPYSHDMWPNHPTTKFPDLPLIEGEKTLLLNPDPATLTTAITEHAVDFIKRNKERPFFLYLPHPLPHVPLGVSDKHKDKSGQGLYGDVIMEIDWSVGQVLDTLRDNHLDENTLVVFTSDNGPWLLYGDHAGSAKPLREGKATTFDGGVREPCIVRWPGRIPAGSTCSQLATTMDLLPTFAALAGATLPADRIIDGRDIRPLLFNTPNAKSPHDAYYFYWNRELQAVRSGPWKLHLPHPYFRVATPGGSGLPGEYAKPSPTIANALYNLDTDPAETTDLAPANPEIVARLLKLADQAREDLGDSATQQQGKNVREPGRLTN